MKDSDAANEKERQIRRAVVQLEEEKLLSHNRKREADLEKSALENDRLIRLMNHEFEVNLLFVMAFYSFYIPVND